jgi:hypothetical protein
VVVELLLEAGADARARNFAGARPHELAAEGCPARQALISELDWRDLLEALRPCQYTEAATAGVPLQAEIYNRLLENFSPISVL